ncbi:MAG: DUF1015 domain-containing protein [Candidatus Omnitrophica bacterium]|nr:DUF1015 domain-containing protein [Candidatus Omnitrophota bacterium]
MPEKTIAKKASTIIPFKATYYNPAVVKDIPSVVCPPYDVINKAQQEYFQKKSPYNFSNVLLTQVQNYEELGKRFKQWISDGVLVDDDKESLYLYEQCFTSAGKSYTRFGFLTLLCMDKDDVIFPHEYTLSAPKEDRKKIIKEVEANLSPIFVVVPKPLTIFARVYATYRKKPPFLDFKDFEGSRNRVWKIQDTKTLDALRGEIEKNKLVIADGHHRFEVAYDYYKNNKGKFDNLNYLLAYVTDSQAGLLILPTHRVVSIALDDDTFFKKLDTYFFIQKVTQKELERRLKEKSVFSLGIYRAKTFYYLKLKKTSSLKNIPDIVIYKKLDTYLFNHLVLSLFSVNEQIAFTHDIEEAKKLASGDKVAFILRPIPLPDVFSIANKGHRLPQKSTYFYPKLLSGIVVRRFQKEGR